MKGARTFAVWLIALAGVVWLFTLLPTPEEAPVSTPTVSRASVEAACRTTVQARLVSPGSMRAVSGGDRAVEISDGSWIYTFAVDSQNAMGGLLRSRWLCRMAGDVVTVSQAP